MPKNPISTSIYTFMHTCVHILILMLAYNYSTNNKYITYQKSKVQVVSINFESNINNNQFFFKYSTHEYPACTHHAIL